MRAVITIALNDLLIQAKQRSTFMISLLMPAAMMLLLGIAQGGTADGNDVNIYIDVIDADGSDLSQALVDVLAADDDAFVICPYDGTAPGGCGLPDDIADDEPDTWRDTADDRLKYTDTYGVLIIADGFGDALRDDQPVELQFKNSSELSAPMLAEQQIEAAVSRLGGSVAIANLTVDVAREHFDLDPLEPGAAFDTAFAAAEDAWTGQPVTIDEGSTREEKGPIGFNQSGPGTAVMFVLIQMLNASTLLVYERETGTLQRLYVMPLRRWQSVGGKLLGQYAFGVAQFAVLIGIGSLMGVEWGGNTPGIALLALVYTLTCAALGLALATVVRTSDQASNISLLLGLTLSPLGGAWWPLEIVPDLMRTVGHISPVAWAMDAFQEMMFYNGGVVDILPMLGVLLAMAVVFFGFGVLKFEYE